VKHPVNISRIQVTQLLWYALPETRQLREYSRIEGCTPLQECKGLTFGTCSSQIICLNLWSVNKEGLLAF